MGVLEADGGETQQEALREVSRDPELSNVSVGNRFSSFSLVLASFDAKYEHYIDHSRHL